MYEFYCGYKYYLYVITDYSHTLCLILSLANNLLCIKCH